MPAIDRNFPAEGQANPKAKFREQAQAVDNRVGTMPESWTDHAGKVLAGKADGSGPAPLDGPADFDGHPVRGFGLYFAEDIEGDRTLNDADHRGGVVTKIGSGPSVVTLDPDLISPGFVCELWHDGAGDLSISLGDGLTLKNADSHTTVQAGRKARIARKGDDIHFDGFTEA